MACARFTRNRQSSCSVRDAPGLICQGCARSVPLTITPPPLVFSQVFILKGVKVLCFDTLLQVFILNEIEEGSRVGEKRDASALSARYCAARKTEGCRRGYATPG